MAIEDNIMDSMVKPGINFSNPDYTGGSADHYLHKYVNRPEDAGNLEDFQAALSDMGIIAPPADALNAAIYAFQGEWGMAGLSAAAILPFVGELKTGRKMVTLYRGVDTWYPGRMVKNGNFIGGETASSIGSYIGQMPKGTLWTTSVKQAVRPYSLGNGPVLKFEVPEWYIKKFGHYKPVGNIPTETLDAINKQSKYTVTAFPEGLPKQYLTKVYHKFGDVMNPQWMKPGEYRQSKFFKKKQWVKDNFGENSPQFRKLINKSVLSPLQIKLNALRDNPNFARNMGNVVKENIKRYNK